MPNDLYDVDILSWSEHQAALLRRVANGERVNGIDWDHVIEEIADVGGSLLSAVESLLRQAMIHLIKLYLSPRDTARDHWRSEIYVFIAAAEDRYAPSMGQRLDLNKLWKRACVQLARMSPNDPDIRALPLACPWTLDALLAADVDALLAALSPTTQTPA